MAASLPEAKSANGSYSGWQPELSSRRHAVVLQGLPDQHAHDYGRRRCALAQTDGGAWMKERPGDTSEYSNAAFGYLAPLIAREAGMTFPDFSKTRIFETLDMKNTAWFRRDLPQVVLQRQSRICTAQKRTLLPNHHLPGPDGGHYCFVDYASGSLHTSAEDLAKFGKAMLDYGVGTLFGKDRLAKQQQHAKSVILLGCKCQSVNTVWHGAGCTTACRILRLRCATLKTRIGRTA